MKKRMKYIFLLPLFFLFVACGKPTVADVDIAERLENAEKPTITWGVKTDTNLFGLYNISSRKIEGFDIAIAEALTKELLGDEGKAEFVEVTSKTRIPLLKNGNIDAIIATMTISEEREKVVDFTEVYFAAGQALLVPEDSELTDVTSLTSEHTVLAVKGSTSAIRIRENAPEANILELENYSEAFTALQSGQGDAMTTDNAILLGIIAQNPGYRLAGPTFTDEPYGIAVNEGQQAFLANLNDALATIKANGTYDAIYSEWFPEDAQ